MFSQSCNCLPNKKQSIFGTQSTHNMGLFRTLTNKSPQDSSGHINTNFETVKKRNNNFGSRTNIGLMDLVYSFTETSQLTFDKKYTSTYSGASERSRMNCKDSCTQCNNITTLPLARSYLVGGFVGSKSQLGRRRKNDIGKMNLWDIIRDLVYLVGKAPINYHQKQIIPYPTSTDNKIDVMEDSNKWKKSSNQNRFLGSNCLEGSSISLKQSYADVAKRSMKDHQSARLLGKPDDWHSCSSSESCDTPMSVIEPSSGCNKTDFTSRDRIASECSADSEDSFIVFECCEDDNLDKDIYSSDDETLSYFDEVSQLDNGIVPSNNCIKKSSKKVRFAEEKSLVKVHPMVTWGYAYRMARRGPWEMLARDSERFKLRIAKTEAVLKPILDPHYRSEVYRDRFSAP